MKTPEGWARANLMLRTLQAPPPRGSLQEFALILLLDRLEDIEHAKFRALAQIMVEKDAGIKAFNEYTKVAFPSAEQRKNTEADQMAKLLKDWVAKGPMKIKPMEEPRGRSRLKGKVTRIDDARRDQLYKQLDLTGRGSGT